MPMSPTTLGDSRRPFCAKRKTAVAIEPSSAIQPSGMPAAIVQSCSLVGTMASTISARPISTALPAMLIANCSRMSVEAQ